MKDNNYLVIRLSSIGDIVLTSALLRCLKKTSKTVKIDFVISKQYKEIVENSPYIDNIILYDKSKTLRQNNLIKKEIEKKYKIIDLQNNCRSIVFCKSLYENRKNIARLYKKRLEKLAIVYFKKKPSCVIPVPLRYINIAERFGVKYDGKGLEFWLPEEKYLSYYPPSKRIFNQKISKLSIAPGAKHFTKQWLPEYFSELIVLLHKKYNSEFLLLGGTSDSKICDEILALVDEKTNHADVQINIKNFSNRTSLVETARILDSCDLVVTNDTGVMHISAARNVPVAAIFGSTVPEFGFAPFGVPSCINSIDIPCRPCSHIGRRTCPKGHFDCMKKLFPDIVFNKIINFIDTLEIK